MRKKRTILNILLLIPVMVAFSACAGKEAPPETPSFISSEIPSEVTEETGNDSEPVPEAESIPLPDETVTASPTLLYQGHGSLRIQTADDKVIYVDPYAGEGYDLPADVILITHGHFDHTQTDLIKTKNEDCRTITWKEALADGEYQNFDFEFVSV